MADILLSLAIVLGTAWLGRIFLDARELGWGRLVLAAVIGIAIGDATALFLLVADVEEIPNVDYQQLQLVSLPFRVVATMGAIVVLELFFRRGRSDGGPSRAFGKSGAGSTRGGRAGRRALLRPSVLLRALTVSRVLVKHGFAPLIGWGSGRAAALDADDLARRARAALEEAGGIFIKLGQLLASRPDLLPPSALAELSKLQSAVAPLPRDAVEEELAQQLGRPISEVFAAVDWTPLGSASIAQAHGSVLHGGEEVVVKVRRPGLRRTVERDLAILRWLARTVEARFGWARQLGVTHLAAEFADDLLVELDFEIEARHIGEISKSVAGEPLLVVPRVFDQLTSSGLLVMERLDGEPLASSRRRLQSMETEALADALCRSQVTAMMDGERFHGDPHPGNVLVLADGRLGLIDLGISSKLDAFERAAVFQMLLALRQEQPSLLFESMVTIGAVDQTVHDADEIERALARFMAAYLGPGLPPAEALTDLLRLTLALGLRLPPSTSAMFRALSTLMGTLEQLHPGYPVIDKIAALGGDEFRRRLMPDSAADFVKQEWSELGPILARLPRHVDRLATMLEHGRMATRTRVLADVEDRRFLETLLNRFVLTLLSVGIGAVSVMLLGTEDSVAFPWFSVGLYEVLGWIGLFIAMTLMFRVLLAVLRSEGAAREGKGWR